MTTLFLSGCSGGWSAAERNLIESQPAVMRVLTVDDTTDLKVLRTACRDFSARELADPLYAALASKLVATVTSPEQDGVGIAGRDALKGGGQLAEYGPGIISGVQLHLLCGHSKRPLVLALGARHGNLGPCARGCRKEQSERHCWFIDMFHVFDCFDIIINV